MTKRTQLWIGTSGVGVLDSDNILTLDAADLRDDKHDEIRAEMHRRLSPLIDDERALRDAFATGNATQVDIDALIQSRSDIDEKAKAVVIQVNALGSDNEAIHSFPVAAAFDAP